MEQKNEQVMEQAQEQQAMQPVQQAEIVAESPAKPEMPIVREMREQIELLSLAKTYDEAIKAAIRWVCPPRTWQILGGKPYLDAEGSKAMGDYLGVGYVPVKEEKYSDNGYPAFKFTYEFTYKGRKIIEFGGRSGKEEFFSGKGQWKKKPDEVDALDVEKAASTNAINRGIKAMIPQLALMDLDDFDGSLDTHKTTGVAYKEGNQGGKTQAQRNEGLKCENCGDAIDQKVASYSKGKYGKFLCRTCQKNPGAIVVPQDQQEQVPQEPDWMNEAPMFDEGR